MATVPDLNLPLIPHGDRVIVAPIDHEPPKRLDGAPLILPASCRKVQPPQRGVVLAVGRGLVGEDGVLLSMRARAGSLIAFKKHAGTDIEWNGQTLTIMRDEDVLGEIVD